MSRIFKNHHVSLVSSSDCLSVRPLVRILYNTCFIVYYLEYVPRRPIVHIIISCNEIIVLPENSVLRIVFIIYTIQ